jgi:hypothetical protein
MQEFFEALAISLAFTLGGYFLFGSLGKTQPETETMDMSSMDMSSASSGSMEGMGSMPGMSH